MRGMRLLRLPLLHLQVRSPACLSACLPVCMLLLMLLWIGAVLKQHATPRPPPCTGGGEANGGPQNGPAAPGAAAAAQQVRMAARWHTAQPCSHACTPACMSPVPQTPSQASTAAEPGLALQPLLNNGGAAASGTEGWSPSKLDSLAFFLSASRPQPPPAAAPGAGALVAAPPTTDNQRPYLGLKYLLRAGPGGAGAPSTWAQLQAKAAPPPTGGPQRHAAPARQAAQPGRYAPYPLQPPPKYAAPAAHM